MKKTWPAIVCAGLLYGASAAAVPAVGQARTYTLDLPNVSYLTAKYDLVEFMSRRRYSSGVYNMDSLVFRKSVRNPYTSLLQGGGKEHNLTDEISFEILGAGPRSFVVYFNFDRSEIRRSERATIGAAIAYIREMKGARVRVIGHTDRAGSEGYNAGLSRRRADSVAAALRTAGIAVESRGETDPAVRTRDGVRLQANRRAAIIVITGSGAVSGGSGVRIVATRRFYSYPATAEERETHPLMLRPFDPTLRQLMRKFVKWRGRKDRM